MDTNIKPLDWGYCYDVMGLDDTIKMSCMGVSSVCVLMNMWLCPYICPGAEAEAAAMVVWTKVVVKVVAGMVMELGAVECYGSDGRSSIDVSSGHGGGGKSDDGGGCVH